LIPSFEGQKDDRVLLDLIPFFKELSNCENIRGVNSKYEDYLNKQEKFEKMQKALSSEIPVNAA